MLRTALFLTAFIGLLASAAVAAPTHTESATWRGWGYRHRHPAQGDFVPVYATYRYHSRERRGVFGFLHRGNPAARHRSKHAGHSPATRKHKHTTGLF